MISPAFNNITSPFKKHWDLSLKANQELWLVALTVSSDHVRFGISVASTATTFLKLVQDKSKYYRWGPPMSVPIDGDGTFDKNVSKLASGEEVMKVNFRTCIDLLTKWTQVSTDACQRFAQWYNGDDSMQLDAVFGDKDNHSAVPLDCSSSNNISLICQYKVQLRITDQLVLHVPKNHLTTSSYKSFLAHKQDFSFKDEKTGNVIYSGLILLRKMLKVLKPKTIIEVRHLEKELDEISLWPTCKNSVRTLTTRMINILQEIHAK
jgi:hypothetical protein